MAIMYVYACSMKSCGVLKGALAGAVPDLARSGSRFLRVWSIVSGSMPRVRDLVFLMGCCCVPSPSPAFLSSFAESKDFCSLLSFLHC